MTNFVTQATKNLLDISIKNIPENKLLAPIIYNASILENIKQCDYILDSLSDNNKVKIYIRKELKNIIIKKAKTGKKYEDILREVSFIGNNQDKENNYNNSFVFKNNKVFLKSKIYKLQHGCGKLGRNMNDYNLPPLMSKTIEETLIGARGIY
ncbi:hypothetical protein GCM10028822_43170 [Hymenobacter terrigena]